MFTTLSNSSSLFPSFLNCLLSFFSPFRPIFLNLGERGSYELRITHKGGFGDILSHFISIRNRHWQGGREWGCESSDKRNKEWGCHKAHRYFTDELTWDFRGRLGGRTAILRKTWVKSKLSLVNLKEQ